MVIMIMRHDNHIEIKVRHRQGRGNRLGPENRKGSACAQKGSVTTRWPGTKIETGLPQPGGGIPDSPPHAL